ncbi:MAG: diacylglycerol kinase family lipid kinase [Eubacteriales bacterium]|nr:diacylglycerol kinase family lipid kinase [Eubacteriales bacterium]
MYLLIYNPAAAAGAAVHTLARLEEYLRGHDIPYELKTSEYVGHTIELVRQALVAGQRHFMTLGGDGTILEAVEGYLAAGSPADAEFGFLPGGTGNDLTRTLGLSRDVIEAFEQLQAGTLRALDIWQVNDQPFINVAGIGLDVDVIRWTARTKRWLKGQAVYVSAIFLALVRHRPHPVRVWLDGKLLERRILVMTFSNGAYYGGGIHVCPPADPCDGKLDVILVNHLPKLRIPRLLLKYMKGTHIGTVRQVEYYRASTVQVEADPPLHFEQDGELGGMTPFSLRHAGRHIRVIAPANRA